MMFRPTDKPSHATGAPRGADASGRAPPSPQAAPGPRSDVHHDQGQLRFSKDVAGLRRGMWIWTTKAVIEPPAHAADLFAAAQQMHITDLYLNLEAADYRAYGPLLGAFNGQAHDACIRVWALDGARAYFDDAEGPQALYDGIDSLIAFNASAAAGQTFCGLQADNEPQDDATYTSFHNSIPDRDLSRTAASGVWKSTQALDRDALLRSWLQINTTARAMLHGANLQYGIAAPSWTASYFGGDLKVRFPHATSPKQSLTPLLLRSVDEMVLMTYNCDPHNAANRALTQVKMASALPDQSRPRVYASVEVTPGVGANISYADTPGKASKAVVQQDMQSIIAALEVYPAFSGISIEHWASWQALAP